MQEINTLPILILRCPHSSGKHNTDWRKEPYQTVVKYPSEVVCRFADFNSAVDYENNTQFFNKVGNYLKQNIVVDRAFIFDDFEVPAGLKEVNWMQLPRYLYSEGAREAQISKTAGNNDAEISQPFCSEKTHLDYSNQEINWLYYFRVQNNEYLEKISM